MKEHHQPMINFSDRFVIIVSFNPVSMCKPIPQSVASFEMEHSIQTAYDLSLTGLSVVHPRIEQLQRNSTTCNNDKECE